MRISGGTAKGRRTAAQGVFRKKAGGERLRPTSSKVREALFDIIRHRIDGASFVDLYAGTGTVGLEALSRGAGNAVFVEPDEVRVTTIKKLISDLGFQNRAQVSNDKAVIFLQKASAAHQTYDIFFIDPPYHSEEIDSILPIMGKSGLLNKDGILIVEHFHKKKVPESAGTLLQTRSYKYGDTILTLYRKAET
jgi:16S rRNA (guanine(966)-N(2))-methyltransferase RsmD